MTMDAVAPSVEHILQDALLEQARQDLIADKLQTCRSKLDLLLKAVDADRAAPALLVRLLLAWATGAEHEAANIAYYLSGSLPRAQRAAIIEEGFSRTVGWSGWPRLLASTGQCGPSMEPGLLIDRLAARATPVDAVDGPLAAATTPTGDPSPLIVLTLANGMGNQLFQYAAALRRARRCGGTLKFDLSIFATERIETRPFALAAFAIDVPAADETDLARVESLTHYEEMAAFDAMLMTGTGDCRLLGCWSSDLYFRGVERELRDSLRFRDPGVAVRAAATIARYRTGAAPVIGMHVRRGDYLEPRFRNAYAAHPVGYYRMALQRFAEDCPVIIFSDSPEDRDWCAETFADLGTRVAVSRDRADIDDFALLAACDHQILSVSSFGWWAAWLNPNPAKRVVAPHPALGLGPLYAHLQLAGRVPADWCLLTRGDLEGQ